MIITAQRRREKAKLCWNNFCILLEMLALMLNILFKVVDHNPQSNHQENNSTNRVKKGIKMVRKKMSI